MLAEIKITLYLCNVKFKQQQTTNNLNILDYENKEF